MLREFRCLPRFNLEQLEGREVPASLQILFDYRYDTTGFFSDPSRRSILEQAGRDLSTRLNNSVDLTPIQPSGFNNWTATTFNPANPTQNISINNLSVGVDQIVVFVGGGNGINGGEAGLGGSGGYSASGEQGWFNTLRNRGRSGFASWGGSISFSSGTNWYVGAGQPNSSQTDFYSVAVHELGHVLGFGASNQWSALVSGSSFTGATARAVNGGTNPQVSTYEAGHWQQGITANGAAVSMQPYITAGTRVRFSELDFAALADIGWDLSGSVSTPVVVSPVPVTSAQLGTFDPVVVGGSDGTFQVFSAASGSLVPTGGPTAPFPGFSGSIRTATGDLNGDGVKDIVVAAGPGGGPIVKAYDGRSGGEIVSFYAYETFFAGGVVVASADFNGDGIDDLAVGADQGGGPRVRIFSGANTANVMADFWGIEDKNFRGGTRIAAGDIDKDGRADLVVAAGPGGGPRVAVYRGSSIGVSVPQRMVGDFFSFDPNMANGSYVAVADINGDGYSDIIYGAGSGSARVRIANGHVLSATDGNYSLSLGIADSTFQQAAGYAGGARVAAGDFDGNGTQDVVVGTGVGGNGRLFLWNTAGVNEASPTGLGSLRDGVYVG
jgi:hypothetical protein